MLSGLAGWQTTQRGRAAGGGGPLAGVTVSGVACDKVITLAVTITPTKNKGGVRDKRREERDRRLLERASKLLWRMGPWNCCAEGEERCMVKLALKLVLVKAPSKAAPQKVRFYHDEHERQSYLEGSEAFGFMHDDGSIEIPSISAGAELLSSTTAGLNGLPGVGIPNANHPDDPPKDSVVGSIGNIQLRYGRDILALIIHEVLHSMGMEGHDEAGSHIMNEKLKLGDFAFEIPREVVCKIAVANGVCDEAENQACCSARESEPALHGKQERAVATNGHVAHGVAVARHSGKVGKPYLRGSW